MGGLWSLFKKVIPIVMLVCFICLGVTYTFQQAGQDNITYLSKQVYTENYEWIDIEDATQEQIDTQPTAYRLDFNNYMQNINNDVLHRSLQKVIDLDAYSTVLQNFDRIWTNGYQPGDIIKTIGNAIILVINTIILPINILLVPLRIISGLLLTGFSLVGINIARESIIINSLNGIIDHASIPFINVLFNSNEESLQGAIYELDTNLKYGYSNAYSGVVTYNLNFNIPQNTHLFTQIKTTINFLETQRDVYYIYQDGNDTIEYHVYDNGWITENARYITIREFTGSNSEYELFMIWINNYATEINEIPTSQYYNQTYTWQDTTLENFNVDFQTFLQIEIESNSTTYNMIGFASDTSSTAIAYFVDNNNYTIAYDSTNNGWTNNAYKTFTITQQIISNSQQQFIDRLIELNLIA